MSAVLSSDFQMLTPEQQKLCPFEIQQRFEELMKKLESSQYMTPEEEKELIGLFSSQYSFNMDFK